MAKNTSITLGNHFDDFVAKQVDSGRYGSVSDVIRTGLRMLENEETKLESLRNLLEAGEQSGMADYSFEAFISELDSENH